MKLIDNLPIVLTIVKEEEVKQREKCALEASNETRKHITRVQELLHTIIILLIKRSEKHDASKLVSPEVEMFTQYTSKLKSTTYGSKKYKKLLEERLNLH